MPLTDPSPPPPATPAWLSSRLNRWLKSLSAIVAVFTVLTNGYYLRWAEPAISRKSLAVVILALAAVHWAVSYRGFPSGRSEWLDKGRYALLAVIVISAFALREWGISGGLPQTYVSDEYDYVHSVIQMIQRGDFNPHWWYYPSLQRYLVLGTYVVVFLANVAAGNMESVHDLTVEDVLYWGRWLSAVFGAVTVALTYFLGRRLFGAATGLTASALIAFFPGAVEHSQFNKPDAVMHALGAASVLAALHYLERGGVPRAMGAGALAGLATAAKYNGVLALMPVVAAAAFRFGRRLLNRPDLYSSFAAAALAFLCACPYFLAEFPKFLDHVAFDIHSYGVAGRPGAEGTDNWYHHAVYTARYGAGWGAFLAGLAGLGLVLCRLDARLTVFLVFPVLYYSHYGAQRINWADNLIAVYPFLAILAAYALYQGASLVSRWRPLASPVFRVVTLLAGAALLIASPLRTSIRFNLEAVRPDTGNAARAWLDGAFPPGTKFVTERHAAIPDRKRFQVVDEARVANRPLADYQREEVDYLIVSSMVYERFGPEHRITKAYRELFALCPTVKEFGPIGDTRAGPVIKILRVPPVPTPGAAGPGGPG
jgi:hypothetical protein